MITGVHAIPPGTMLGQYEIVQPLTSGGMAAVYLGRHAGPAGFARHVAIKVVHPRFADDPQFIAMFLDEARLSSRIEHANVVRVEALGNEQGSYYLVMEYIRGVPLHTFVRRLAEKKRILNPELVVHIMANVADGLHAAHETTDELGRPLGIVHRDVTPQNVLLSYQGAIKLIDFGIAKAAGRSHHTAKGALKGKLRYMAPEQAAGKPVDRRTDVYALGIVLWEMLTYKKLFSGKNDAELMFQVREPKIPPVRKFTPNIDEALEGVVMQALSVSPDERFQTAQALRRALYGACPKARAIDAQELSSLVRSTMANDIAQEQRTLPPSVVAQSDVVVAVDAAREQAAMTRIVEAVAPLDDEPAPSIAPPPMPAMMPPVVLPATAPPIDPPRAVHVSSHDLAATRAPLPHDAPMGSYGQPSYGQPSYGQPSYGQPSYGAQNGSQPSAAPLAPPPGAMQSAPGVANGALSAPGTALPNAPRASFTPPSASLRSDVMGNNKAVSSRPPRKARSRAGVILAIVIGVILTVAVGGVTGWFAIHHAHRMMLTP